METSFNQATFENVGADKFFTLILTMKLKLLSGYRKFIANSMPARRKLKKWGKNLPRSPGGIQPKFYHDTLTKHEGSPGFMKSKVILNYAI